VTNGESRVLEVLGVKKRKLEEITSFRRRILDRVSSAAILARLQREGLLPGKNPAATPPKKSANTRGGRKRLAIEKQRFHMIGFAVDEVLPRFEAAFKLMRALKIANGNWEASALRNELAKQDLTSKGIDAVIQARTPMSAAKRFVAKSLTSRKHPNGLSLQTICSSYSRYLKALRSKTTLL
jgi:hypothetical protein